MQQLDGERNAIAKKAFALTAVVALCRDIYRGTMGGVVRKKHWSDGGYGVRELLFGEQPKLTLSSVYIQSSGMDRTAAKTSVGRARVLDSILSAQPDTDGYSRRQCSFHIALPY